MACVHTEEGDDDGFGAIWLCECDWWNYEEVDECANCGRCW